MVSQSSSVGYTIMGRLLTWQLSKRRPLTPCTRRARHKRSLQKRLAVHRALSPSTLIEGRREGKDVVEKSVQAIGITAPWRGLWNKTHSKCGGDSQEWTAAGVSASRTTTHRRMQDMGFSCRIPCVKTLLNNRQRQKRLDWTAAEWSKVMSLMKVNFAFPLEIRVPESGGREERHRIHVPWGPV